MIYVDSSALVKRYLKEDGSDLVEAITADAKAVGTSKLAYPEILSAVMRKYRAGEIPKEALRPVLSRFHEEWGKLFVVEFHNDLLEIIRSLVGKYPLRGADSVHLASALWLGRMLKTSVTFLAFDLGLLKAAKGENLTLVNE